MDGMKPAGKSITLWSPWLPSERNTAFIQRQGLQSRTMEGHFGSNIKSLAGHKGRSRIGKVKARGEIKKIRALYAVLRDFMVLMAL
jgi:hypothetical protein